MVQLFLGINFIKNISMRFHLFFAFILITGLGKAQQFFPGDIGYSHAFNRTTAIAPADSTGKIKKWSLQKYSSLSVGMMMWKGGSASYISAPIGLQLNRRITDNLFAFAGISVAPSVVSFRQAFTNPDFKNAGLRGINQSYGLGIYSRAELGLGYTNDAHTFEIRGSIGIERNNYPFSEGYRNINYNRNNVNAIR